MIYVLEDDANIRKLVDYALQREGYEVQGFGTPSEFWEAIGNRLPQLVLLDISEEAVTAGSTPEIATFSGLGKVVDMDFYVAKNPYCYFGF